MLDFEVADVAQTWLELSFKTITHGVVCQIALKHPSAQNVFFIFEFKYINNIEVDFREKIMKFLTISLVLFAYSLYLSYRNYGKNDDENNGLTKLFATVPI